MAKIPGAKPKPTAIKRLEGNPGKRPLNESEPRPAAEAPPMPSYVARRPKAKAAWDYTVAELDAMGTLARSDAAMLMLHAIAWADWDDLQEAKESWNEELPESLRVKLAGGQILLSKNGQPYINQLANKESMAAKLLKDTAAELGLSPTSRTRLHVERPKDGGELQVVAWSEEAG